jgi:hypothetical protein
MCLFPLRIFPFMGEISLWFHANLNYLISKDIKALVQKLSTNNFIKIKR